MDKHYGFIYLTIDLKNGKGYVGQHKISNQKTLDPFYIGSGKIIKDILKGNGNDKSRFNRQILCFCESKEELDEMEIYYINYFNAIESENFYNFASGGSNGNPMSGFSEEQKEEFRKKCSRPGEKNGMYNKHHTEESRKKMSINSIGRKSAFKNKKHKKSSKDAMSKKHKGKTQSGLTKVYCMELNTSFISCGIAKKYCENILNIRLKNPSYVCNGQRGFTGTYNDKQLHWKWETDVDKEMIDNFKYISDEKYNELLSKNVNDCNKKERT